MAEEVPVPTQVATVEVTSGGEAQVSEQKRAMLWEMVKSSGEEVLTAEQKEQFYTCCCWPMLICSLMMVNQVAPTW